MKGIRELIKKRGRLGKKKKESEIDGKIIEKIFQNISQEEVVGLSREDLVNIFFKEGILHVKTSHPTVSNELWHQGDKIKKRVNEILGKRYIREIKTK